jgi:hypothetical protein
LLEKYVKKLRKAVSKCGLDGCLMTSCTTESSNCLKYFINNDSDEMGDPLFLISFLMLLVNRYVRSSHGNTHMLGVWSNEVESIFAKLFTNWAHRSMGWGWFEASLPSEICLLSVMRADITSFEVTSWGGEVM